MQHSNFSSYCNTIKKKILKVIAILSTHCSHFLFHSMQNLCSHFLSLRFLQLTPFSKCCKPNYYTFASELHNYVKKIILSLFLIQSMILSCLTMQEEINHTQVETWVGYNFINLAHLGIIWQWLVQSWPSFLFQLFPQWNPHPCTAGIYRSTKSLLSREGK